ncbi:MAG: GatB/YqeY domain-containing protein [Bacteroidetes bacterium]|nr:GatB/YqeY domain-containing protein [Bacteroidota bacterium]
MNLETKINADIKTAMLARDAKKLEALRAVKAALLIEKTKEGFVGEVGEVEELKILQKLIKQRKESADIYENANRFDLSEKERFDAAIIETYLPQQLSEDEVKSQIKTIIAQTGANSIKDMGKVMAVASKELAGKADNKMISVIVKSLLGV